MSSWLEQITEEGSASHAKFIAEMAGLDHSRFSDGVDFEFARAVDTVLRRLGVLGQPLGVNAPSAYVELTPGDATAYRFVITPAADTRGGPREWCVSLVGSWGRADWWNPTMWCHASYASKWCERENDHTRGVVALFLNLLGQGIEYMGWMPS